MLHNILDSENESSDSSEKSELKQEKAFSDFLNQYQHMSLDKVKALPGVDKARLQLFCRHLSMVHYFIRQGMPIEELALVKAEILKKYFTFSPQQIDKLLFHFTPAQIFNLRPEIIPVCINYANNLNILIQHGLTYENLDTLQHHHFVLLKKCLMHHYLNHILKFVSINQIFGIDQTPFSLEILLKHFPASANITTINHSGNGKTSDFSFQYTEHSINIIENNNKNNNIENNYFNLTLSKTTETVPPSIKGKMSAGNTQFYKLIHNWFICKDKVDEELEINKFIIFSPNLHCLLHEVYSLNFPKDKLENDSPLLMFIPFYEEKSFVEFLKSINCPIDTFRALPGMSLSKLSLLSHHQDIVSELMTHQLKITDFAHVEETRLQCIFANYDLARYALSMVPATTLLGLSAEKNNYSPRFFRTINDQQGIESKKEEQDNSRCCIS